MSRARFAAFADRFANRRSVRHAYRRWRRATGRHLVYSCQRSDIPNRRDGRFLHGD
jgi:hypothetical protein